MDRLTLAINVTKLLPEELSEQERMLVNRAKAAAKRSYSVYSKFHVGAALVLDNGEIIDGNNQENVAYPSGLCAERVTVFYAHSRYPDNAITHLCIAACDDSMTYTPRPVTPCGACRQVLVEFEKESHSPITIILYGTDYIYKLDSAKDLLPLSFDM